MTIEWLGPHKEGVALLLHCQPGAKVSRIVGEHDGRLKVSLNAPAVENKANEVLVTWLAEQLGIPKRQIELLSGQTGRKKRVLIRDMDQHAVQVKLTATG